MKQYDIYQVDAFTKELFKGNPAGVVPNADGLNEPQMQLIARELNNSETAFIFSPTSNDHDVHVRFFTPTTEIPSCGHATISAHYVRAFINELPSSRVIQKIGIGKLPVDILRENSDYKITMTQGEVYISEEFPNDQSKKIIEAIGLKNEDLMLDLPIQIISTGNFKVMIPINSREKLNSLKPNFQKLNKLSSEINCPGYYVFTLDSNEKDILAHGRMFAPAIGINEDPVTGNANGPLGAYLVHNQVLDTSKPFVEFNAKQGEAIGREGVVKVRVQIENKQPKLVQITGEARIVFKTEIEI